MHIALHWTTPKMYRNIFEAKATKVVISKNQSAFIPDRAISDNVLITHETFHYLKILKAKKYCSITVKSDMSKAYDKLE